MFRFQIQLDQNEAAALAALAEVERRDVRQQAEVLIIEGLRRRGLVAGPTVGQAAEKEQKP
jgi:hypothetical protein